MADVNVGDNAVLRMEAYPTAGSDAGNYANYHWKLSLIERTASVFGWSGSVGASVSISWDGGSGGGVLWAGSFAFDFRPGGQQSVVIAEGDANGMGNYADGAARTFTFTGYMDNTGTSTAGGPANVSQSTAYGNTRVKPGTPSSFSATRNNDTQIQLNWSQSNAGNGQPTATAIEKRVNGGAWQRILDIGATTSVLTGGHAANQKVEFQIASGNEKGYTPWVGPSNAVYTTPAAPTGVSAAKNASLDIVVTWTPKVGYAEHTHEVWHGTVTGGVTTWDGSALATLGSGVSTYTHDSPNASQVHVYRVRARAGSLASSYATSGSVQLLVAPNKPTTPAMAATANKALALRFNWTHNPVDTTAQKYYQFQRSTDGGTTWAVDSGKVASTNQYYDIPASAYAGNVAVTTRVRTWGQATTGGSDGTGASPWSDLRTVTYKTIPTTTVTAPANSSVYNDATLRVNVTFSSPESATFVKTEVSLLQGATVLETKNSGNLIGIVMATKVLNGGSYSVQARVQDSNGLWSNLATSSFTVSYLAPPVASAATAYIPESGFGQLNIDIPDPGVGESAAAYVTVLRTINDVTETVVEDYPAASSLTLLDTTPTISGLNTYTIITETALGAQNSMTVDLITNELRRAFLAKGPGLDNVVVFGGNLSVSESLSVASATVEAAGRTKPVGLYGVETSVQLKVSSRLIETFGSSVDAVRQLLLVPGKACYRDASGRRVFGSVKGSVSYKMATRADLQFTITETSN